MANYIVTFTTKKGLIVLASEDKECDSLQDVADNIMKLISGLEDKDVDGFNITLKKKYMTDDNKELFIIVSDKNYDKEQQDIWVNYNDEISGMISQMMQQIWLAKNQDKLKLMQGGMMGMPPKTTESGLIL